MHKLKPICALFLIVGTIFSSSAQTTLKAVFKDHFMMGAAMNRAQFTGQDARGATIVKQQFNSISPENILKWESVHPELDRYDWEGPDAFVAFGERNKMFIVGHTLVWHNQTPKWVFEDGKGGPASREVLLARLRDHIHTVAGRYRGRIHGWDVVNEALNEDGTLRQSPWLKIIGEEYLAKAFQFANEADPKVELYYNDYSLENEPKRRGAIALIKKLQAQKIRITGVGLQGHNKMTWPTLEQQDRTIAEFAALGIRVHITELDIDVLPSASDHRGADITLNYELQARLNPYTKGLPDALQQDLARRYADLFKIYLKHSKSIDRVTFWCVTDADSWLNDWPVRGRTSYPLLFDRAGAAKPAFDAVIKTGLSNAGSK